MKKIIASLILLISLVSLSFTESKKDNSADENWHLCTNCCKTKKLPLCVGKVGVKVLLQAHTIINFVVKQATINILVENVTQKFILTSSTSPSASKCCETGGTHSWYNK